MLNRLDVGRGVLGVVVGALGVGAAWCSAEPEPKVEGRPLFARVTVLEVENAEGPFDVAVIIKVKHRGAFYVPQEIPVGKLSLGESSQWVDLSEKIDPAQDQVTAVVSLEMGGEAVTAPARVRVELARSADAEKPLASLEVWDPEGTLGFVMPEREVPDAEIPATFQSLRQVAQRHLAASEAVAVAPEDRPQHFVTATMCRVPPVFPATTYSDPAIAQMEVQALLNLGYNTITHLPEELVEAMEVPYVSVDQSFPISEWPAGAPAEEIDEEALRQQYRTLAEGLREAYGSTDRCRWLSLMDEPSWNFPPKADALNQQPQALKRFHEYLRGQGLTPELLGRDSWEEVKWTVAPAEDSPLEERRLWYHGIRFADLEDAQHYAAAARNARAELGDQVLAFTNWNRKGVFYSFDYGMAPWCIYPICCSHDWFQFSRVGGGTCLLLGPAVSESWGSTLRVWSLAVNLLRSAAAQGVGRFASYLHHMTIPDERAGEAALSIMTVAGYGGSGYNSWTWGPHYAFSECMFSEKFSHYKPVADANRLIGRSEHLMASAKTPRAEVALLWPITSQIWNLNRGYHTYKRDYLVETEHVWFALNHHNYPVDFVDETMIREGALEDYQVLYVAAPHLERQTGKAIADWVRQGGSLWTSANAGLRDEYDQPQDTLDEVLGITERQVEKDPAHDAEGYEDYSPKGGLRSREPLGRIEMDPEAGLGEEPWATYGSKASLRVTSGRVLGRFEDGSAAVVRNHYGNGTSLHFAGMPGLAYSRGATEKEGEPTVDYPPRIAQLITAPAKEREVRRPAVTSLRFVEAAVLESPKGLAVTLLNWSTRPIENLEVTLSGVGGKLRSLQSVRQGEVPYRAQDRDVIVHLSMPEVVDVLLVEFDQP